MSSSLLRGIQFLRRVHVHQRVTKLSVAEGQFAEVDCRGAFVDSNLVRQCGIEYTGHKGSRIAQFMFREQRNGE